MPDRRTDSTTTVCLSSSALGIKMQHSVTIAWLQSLKESSMVIRKETRHSSHEDKLTGRRLQQLSVNIKEASDCHKQAIEVSVVSNQVGQDVGELLSAAHLQEKKTNRAMFLKLSGCY